MGEFFIKLDTIVWSNPIIFLILGSAVFFTIILKGVQVRNIKHQIQLLFGANDSDAGISPFATFVRLSDIVLVRQMLPELR